MLITTLMFIFSKYLSFMFFEQIWFLIWISWNWLKFLRGVHCYLLITILMFIFSKYLSLMFFEQIWFLIWISWNWLKFLRGVHCYLLITILMFIFSKFCHSYNFGQIWFQNLMFSKIDWNLIQGHIYICWLRFWYVVFRNICRS